MLGTRAKSSVDVVVLSRTDGPLPPPVAEGLVKQRSVDLRIHRVIGVPQATDRNRWETIARGRNEGRRCGDAPWLMYLDDDVVLGPDTVQRLLEALETSSSYAAVAADYQQACGDGRPTHHVSMGATLFRRQVLQRIPFRWEAQTCECRCMCDDLRRNGWGIRYALGVRATHLKRAVSSEGVAASDTQSASGHVFAALDRRHLSKFRRQFIGSLRLAGNEEPISVIAYGWYPSEIGRMSAIPKLRVIPKSRTSVLPPVRRLRDFQEILRTFSPNTPVAYWDAADVFFQGSLQPLWRIVQENPGKLLAVREPTGFPSNPAVTAWSQSISDLYWRRQAFELLKHNPFLNSGFAAGTARTMLQYLQEAERIRSGPQLSGSTDWGDQMALNLYCHFDPSRWLEVPMGWNYCAHNRPRGEVYVRPDGRILARSGTPIHVLHGNAHSFRKLEL